MNKTNEVIRVSRFLAATVLISGFGVGCDTTKVPNDQSASGAFEALGAQLENCTSTALDCLKAADCDSAKDQACRAAFKTCQIVGTTNAVFASAPPSPPAAPRGGTATEHDGKHAKYDPACS